MTTHFTSRRVAQFALVLLLGLRCLGGADAAESSLRLLEDVHSDRVAEVEKPLEALTESYLAAVEAYKEKKQAEGDLAAALAAEQAIAHVRDGNLPEPVAENEELARLAVVYLEHRIKLRHNLIPQRIAAEREHLAELKTLVSRLTREGRLEAAKTVQEEVVELEAGIESLAVAARAGLPEASRRTPFVNSLGMRFVPAGTPGVFFSIWQTRVQDYKAFAEATGRTIRKPDFPQDPDHPVVNVSWLDAVAFCEWLTEKERQAGRIGPHVKYRLPTDAEWSVAAGLPPEEGATPADKDGKIDDIYPWGSGWPPERGSGNFRPELEVDDFEHTSPVGSFDPNAFGLYDMGANVWEWCEDYYDPALRDKRVRRGGSWATTTDELLLLSARLPMEEHRTWATYGFRVVLDFGKE